MALKHSMKSRSFADFRVQNPRVVTLEGGYTEVVGVNTGNL